MRIVYQDERFFVIDKPAGYFVHPPEASRYPVARDKVCLSVLREQMGRDVFPVHRLDGPTSGLVLFTFDREATRTLSAAFMSRQVEKSYLAVVRGWMPSEGKIDLPLEIKGFTGSNESLTVYRTLRKIELPFAIGRYQTSRYSLVEVRPVTGRWHQIRRHFDRIAHPLIGDIEHGDSHHNRLFRDELKLRGLCLRARRLIFRDPFADADLPKEIVIEAPLDAEGSSLWHGVTKLFGTPGELC